MPEKSDKELAVELTIAMLNHNARLHTGNVSGGGEGLSKDNVINGNAVGSNYAYLLEVIEGKIDPFASPKKKNK